MNRSEKLLRQLVPSLQALTDEAQGDDGLRNLLLGVVVGMVVSLPESRPGDAPWVARFVAVAREAEATFLARDGADA